MQRIGVLGGTFDPPHAGHLHLATVAQRQLELARVLLVPAGQPVHKENRPVSPAQNRVAMTTLACLTHPTLHVNRTDVDRPRPHYTATLLPLLQRQYPTATLWLIIGADSLRDLLQWHAPNAS